MTALLDVNLLVALAWPNHVHHRAAASWFRSHHEAGWATCPLTESSFVRVSSNRRVIPTARPVSEAIEVLQALRSQPGHQFWKDDVSLATSTEIDVSNLKGYRQVTDAHLLTLAVRRQGRLATFDRGVAHLAPAAKHVELLSL